MSVKIDKYLDKTLLSLDKKESEELLAYVEGFDTMPVDVRTFLHDPYFIGKSFPNKSFWSYWLNVLEDIYPHPLLPSRYMEVIFKGSIGTGKTTAGISGTMYSMHRLLCLASPHTTYSLAPSTDIRFVLFNITLDLAYDVLYNTIRNIFDDSPYFQDLKATVDEKSKDILLPKRVGLTMAAKESHVLGRAIFGGILDETNFARTASRGNAKVYDSYIQTIGRMGSRFRDDLGRIPGQLFLISSEKDESDFLSDHVESIRKSQKDGSKEFQSTKIVDTVLWEVKKDVFHYSGRTFPVFVGNQTQSPCIIDDESTIDHYDQSRVIQVPVEHEREFRTNLVEAIRDIAGISTISKFKYITNLQYLSNSLVLVNATRNDYLRVTFDDEDQIIDYVNLNLLKTYLARNPYSPRAVHLDVSLGGDAYGFAMGTIVGLKEVTRSSLEVAEIEGRSFTSEPEIIIELVFGLKKVGDTQVPLFKIRQLILDLRDLGFPVTTVTADGYQSADTLQLLKLKGFETKLLSVDKTPLPYFCLRTAIYEERFRAPYHPILERELKELRQSSSGFDHPDNESKDLSDAVSAVTYTLTEGFRAGAFQFYSREIEKSFREASIGHGTNVFEQKYGVEFKERANRYYQENTY